jgi:hypothetical protein
MPTSVRLTVVVLIVLLALNLIGGALSATQNPRALIPVGVQTALGALILWGLIAGHRLAWQWGRIVVLMAALLVGVTSIAMFVGVRAKPLAVIVVGSIAAIEIIGFFTIFFSLGRPSARSTFAYDVRSAANSLTLRLISSLVGRNARRASMFGDLRAS